MSWLGYCCASALLEHATARRKPDIAVRAIRLAAFPLFMFPSLYFVICYLANSYPCGSILAIFMYSAQVLSSSTSLACACAGVEMNGSLEKLFRNVLASSVAV